MERAGEPSALTSRKGSADNQLEAMRFRFRMGSHNTGQRTFICNGDGAIAKGGGALHKLFRARSPLQESEIGEAMEFGVLGQYATRKLARHDYPNRPCRYHRVSSPSRLPRRSW